MSYLLGCICPSLWLSCHFPLSISPKWSSWFLLPGLLDSFEASSLSLQACIVSCASRGLTKDDLVLAKTRAKATTSVPPQVCLASCASWGLTQDNHCPLRGQGHHMWPMHPSQALGLWLPLFSKLQFALCMIMACLGPNSPPLESNTEKGRH